MDTNALYEKIREENRRLHAAEAGRYEAIHPEGFNWFEQGRILRELRLIRSRVVRPGLALDVGCGTGNILRKLLDLGFDARGVDISEEMIAVLRAREHGRLAAGSLLVEDIDGFLAHCALEFDLVTASSVLHHFPDYPATLGAMCRRVKPGGWLYITHEPLAGALGPDPFPRKLLWQVDHLCFLLAGGGRKRPGHGLSYQFSDYHLYHGFDEQKVLETLRRSGMRIAGFNRYASTMRLGVSCWLDSAVLGSRRQFSVIAQKGS